MVTEAPASLSALVGRLSTHLSHGTRDENGMGLRLEVLEDAVRADAFALLRVHVDEGAVTVLAGSGLPAEVGTHPVRHPSGLLARLASGCGEGQDVSLTEASAGDPPLAVEGAKKLLMACLGSGEFRVGTLAIRRGGEYFSPAEVERFAAVAYVLNLEMLWGLVREETARPDARDPGTGLGLYPDFHETLVKELSRGRRNAGKVTVGILSLEPGDGEAPGEGEVELAARVLGGELRNFDTITRYSRRELAFVLPDLGGEEALKVMDRVLKAITSRKEMALPAIHLGFSSYPEDATTVERLIETAEAAVNLARDKGPSSFSRWRE